ncbi:cytochrome P450 [Rhexocercosporidium sp. MPI-PUGE-AT-0058]|nr:cytochrome P450 [Rhexocercosporidium sp. MPI-PUGE-AT-0058]
MPFAHLFLPEKWSTATTLTTIIIFYIIYLIGVAIHRLYFSQYAKFPGPKLAALTYGYMFYYDAIVGEGQYIYKIKELHEEYESPIIRISPHELHIIDPDFYEVLFTGANSKRDKPPTWSHAFSNVDSVFGTISHEKHRVRRSAIAPFFSAGSLRKLEPLIQENINRLVTVFRRYQQTGEPVPLRPAFGALTSDIIAEYCFGVSENYVEAPGFNVMVLETTDVLTDNMHVTVQLQWLPTFLNSLPDAIVVGMFGPGMAKILELKRHCIQKIKETVKSRGDYRDVKNRTIFHDLLDSSTLPEQDKSVDRLWQEAQLFLAAGTVTTATSISAALVYLLLDQSRLRVLLEELETAVPNIASPPRQADLERLPYLHAVVQETLRLVSGVSYRLTRSSPTETLHLGEWSIPPNTALSMHGPLIHHSEKVYPEPWSFIPERWLASPSPAGLPRRPEGIPRASLKYLVPFSKGTRNCVGQPLAYSELFMTLANVLRTFARLERDDTGAVVGVSGMKLYETDRRDVDMKRDFGFPSPERGRGNMRIILE